MSLLWKVDYGELVFRNAVNHHLSRRSILSDVSDTVEASNISRYLLFHDHFDCTTSNIIYCITCTLCNKLYIGESGRKLGDRFREHLLDVKTKDQTYLNPWLDISIFRATRTFTWKFAEFTYTLGTMKLEKGKNRD